MGKIVLILLTGTMAGFLNTIGGGGSLLSMPVLIFSGLPTAVANRVALMIQNIVAVSNFKKKGFFYPKLGILLSIPAVIGSVIGAKLAIDLSGDVFQKILGIIMLIVMILIIWRPEKKIIKTIEVHDISLKQKTIAVICFFFVGLYGGFIQAGVGFIIILTLGLITGISLVKINSIKVFVVAIYMVSSLTVFIINGKVDWILGIFLAIGNATGAYIGSNFAVKKGDKWIQRVIFFVMIFMSAKLLGVYSLIIH